MESVYSPGPSWKKDVLGRGAREGVCDLWKIVWCEHEKACSSLFGLVLLSVLYEECATEDRACVERVCILLGGRGRRWV